MTAKAGAFAYTYQPARSPLTSHASLSPTRHTMKAKAWSFRLHLPTCPLTPHLSPTRHTIKAKAGAFAYTCQPALSPLTSLPSPLTSHPQTPHLFAAVLRTS